MKFVNPRSPADRENCANPQLDPLLNKSLGDLTMSGRAAAQLMVPVHSAQSAHEGLNTLVASFDDGFPATIAPAGR